VLWGRVRAKRYTEQRGTEWLCLWELCQLRVGKAASGGCGAAAKGRMLCTCVPRAGVHLEPLVRIVSKSCADLTHVRLCQGGLQRAGALLHSLWGLEHSTPVVPCQISLLLACSFEWCPWSRVPCQAQSTFFLFHPPSPCIPGM